MQKKINRKRVVASKVGIRNKGKEAILKNVRRSERVS